MYDVIVIGAGPGGASASYYLARQGAKVLLLDKSNFPRDKTCGDGLGPRAVAVLGDMGLLESVSQKAWRVSQIGIYAPNGNKLLAQVPQQTEVADYALVLPRLILDNLIVEGAARAGATFQAPVHISDIEQQPEGVVVKGEANGRSFVERGRSIVIATGANTKLLLRSGILTRPPRTMLAARAYFEGVEQGAGDLEFHFDGVPLPGYGWVFPVSGGGANIGAGVYRVDPGARTVSRTSHGVFLAFVKSILEKRLGGALQAGPAKAFPLRVDFLEAHLNGDRIFAVGEAAGLVNPLTGEGIDYALESGRLAASYLLGLLARQTFDAKACAGYSRALNDRFGTQFRFLTIVTRLLINRPMLNQAIKAANARASYKNFLVDIAMANRRISTVSSAYMLAKLALGTIAWSR
jgi:geranylgeranyl reductase family protein